MIFNLEVFQRPALQPTKGREATDSGDMGVSINGSTTFMDGLYIQEKHGKPH